MTYEEALQEVKENWATYEHDIKGTHEAVWMAKSDIAGSYEVDEELIGMKADGTLVYAYASGCSCWDGKYECTCHAEGIKVMKFDHKHGIEEWEKAIIKFAETGEIQELPKYDRYAQD